MKRFYISARMRLGIVLGLSSGASLGLYIAGMIGEHGSFAYLPWNLLLSWLALAIALWLESVLHRAVWSSWYALAVTALWLVFLPNTFYMISDFIHIQEMGREDLLYNVVLFSSFIFNSLILGLISLYIVHWQLLKRVTVRSASALIYLVLFLCSFAIYIGRELRWNTWDLLTNPFSLLFDVSDRFINPAQHPGAITTTLSFFVLLSSMYMVIWYLVRAAKQQPEL